MKQMQFHVRIGRESGWLARIVGTLLALAVIAGAILIFLGLWLTLSAVLLIVLSAAALRALLGSSPRKGARVNSDGNRLIEPPRD